MIFLRSYTALRSVGEPNSTHALFKRNLGNRGESHFRTVFRHPKDTQREIYVAILVFHIPKLAVDLWLRLG